MNRKPMKYLIATLWLISVIIAYAIGEMMGSLDTSFNPVTTSEPVIVNGKSKAFMKKYAWGLLGQHSKIYLTNDPSRERPNEAEDMIFKHTETLFFETWGDTLKIYSTEHHELNPDFRTDLIIQLITTDISSFRDLNNRVHRQLKSID